ESKQLTWQSLLNATYATSVTPRGAALHDGTFEAEAAPGSASKVIVRLADIAAFGDLDGNLAPDTAVVLVSSGGGSGTFVDIVAGSSRSVDGSLAPGQIASYVVHGRAGEILDLTVRSDFDNGVLSVSGLTDGMTLVSRREYATQRSLVLPSEQDYSIKVVSLAGYQLAFMLQVQLRAASQTAAATARPTDAPLPSRTPSPLPTPSGAAGLVERPLVQASESAAVFARSRSPIWGVAIVVPSRGVAFAENADTQVPMASIVKVLVLL